MAAARLSATLLPLMICFLVVLLNNAARVESARASGTFHWYHLFVFGDSFADTGNTGKSGLSEETRQWYQPYGSSHVLFDGPSPTGRFSNGMVQSDFIAKILGRSKSPLTFRRTEGSYAADPFGVNFAVGGAGVYDLPRGAPTLAKQIRSFKRLLKDGTIGGWQLRGGSAAALVAVSGNDYARLATTNASSGAGAETLAFVGNVTREVARGVRRLRRLGVAKVLVNTLHPLGCTPWQARPSNYTRCAARADAAAALHNGALRARLNATDGVHLVDLAGAFGGIVSPSDDGPHRAAKRFRHKLRPCCESFDPSGYCGQVGDDGGARYSLCSNPDDHFYWDDVHPTQAGWEAVMGQLERDIKDFLGI